MKIKFNLRINKMKNKFELCKCGHKKVYHDDKSGCVECICKKFEEK
jgi:hypothetical protein